MNHLEPLESRLQFDGGALDTSFGDGGAISIDYNALLDGERWRQNGARITQDTGGRIYVTSKQRQFAEDNFTQLDHKIVITRYSRDGQLDASFGGGGYKLLDRNPETAGLFQSFEVWTFVDANNRTHVLDGNILWRLTPGGRVDMTFGRRGKVAVPKLISALDVAFDADGRAYIAGASQGKTGTRMAVIRLTESGAWDTAWGYQSPVPTIGATANAHQIRFLANGQLMVAGALSTPGINSTWTTRLNADGSVDASYGADGYAQKSAQTDEGLHQSVVPEVIAPDGAVFGSTTATVPDDGSGEFPDSSYTGFNWRFAPDGKRVDTIAIVPPEFDALYDVEFAPQFTLQPDGKILARGGPAQDDLFRAIAFGDGTFALDTTWGDNGILSAEHAGIGGPPQIGVDGSILSAGGDFNADILKIYRLFRDDAPLAQFDGRQLIAPRATATRFSVTFRDDDGIDKTSLDSADVRVFGPFDGQPRSRGATVEAIEPLSGGRFRATYKVTSPGGWTAADNGVYFVRLVSGEVQDTNGQAAPAAALGTFRARIR
jgi:uncharacterized delta-60 repeat protein